MTGFINICNRISPLTPDAERAVAAKIKSKSVRKGDLINNQGQICRSLFFIEKGLVKHYYHHKNRVFVLRIFAENDLFTVLDSFLNQTPAEFITIALEDTTMSYIDHYDLEELCRKHHSFETLTRKYISIATANTFRRIKEMFDKDAAELYSSFIKENRHLLQRISLGDIAGYLGISQVTLSRIRAKI